MGLTSLLWKCLHYQCTLRWGGHTMTPWLLGPSYKDFCWNIAICICSHTAYGCFHKGAELNSYNREYLAPDLKIFIAQPFKEFPNAALKECFTTFRLPLVLNLVSSERPRGRILWWLRGENRVTSYISRVSLPSALSRRLVLAVTPTPKSPLIRVSLILGLRQGPRSQTHSSAPVELL